MERLHPRNGFGIAGPRVPQQPFRELALHLETGARRQRLDHEARHDAPPQPLDTKMIAGRDMDDTSFMKGRPGSAHQGRKRFVLNCRRQSSRWEHPLPRTGYALPARGQIYSGRASL